MRTIRILIAALYLATGLLSASAPARAGGVPLLGHGSNLWSLGFCGGRASTDQEVDYLYAQGMRLFRIGLPWETAQRVPLGPLNEQYMAVVDASIAHILAKPGTRVLLEIHSSMRYGTGATYHPGPNETNPDGTTSYYGGLPCTSGVTDVSVGTSPLPLHMTADMWTRLATRYPDPRMIYGIMNEPAFTAEAVILSETTEAIAAIRALGRPNPIALTVEPNGDLCNYGNAGDCSGQTNIQTAAATDPAHNTIADVHLYEDADGSGSHPDCTTPGVGLARVTQMLAWVHLYKIPFILGEFGGGPTEACRREVFAVLNAVRVDPLGRGWAWWVAGVNDVGLFQLLPSALNANIGGLGPFQAKPQMEWLRPYLP